VLRHSIIFAILLFSLSGLLTPLSFAQTSSAIPDWVKGQFGWYVNGEIDEKTLLTSMNWMFDNNIMQLSEKAAQEVQGMRDEIGDLKYELEVTKAAIAIPNLLDARKGANESERSGYMKLGDIKGESERSGYMKLGDIKGESNKSTGDVYFTLILKTSTQNFTPEDEIMVLLRPAPGNIDESLGSYNFEVVTTDDAHSNWIVVDSISKSDEVSTFDSLGVAANSDAVEFAENTINDIMINGGSVAAWNQGIAAFATQGMDESVIDDLQGIVVLCSIQIDKKSQIINAELEMIREWLEIIENKQTTGTSNYNESDLDFISRTLVGIDEQINSLDTGIMVLKEKLESADSSLTSIDLQNQLQKLQETLQIMSNTLMLDNTRIRDALPPDIGALERQEN